MALYTKAGSTIPSDAVRLSEDDAIKFMRTIVDSWNDRSDTFYLRYTPGLLSGLTALTGIYANNFYRTRLRLQSFGRMSTYLPIVVVPAFLSYAAHVSLRATTIQTLTGATYPLTLAPVAGFMMASRYYTYNVPVITKDPKALWKLYLKLSKPAVPTFAIISFLHLVVVGFLTRKEAHEIAGIKGKLMAMEAEEESKGHGQTT